MTPIAILRMRAGSSGGGDPTSGYLSPFYPTSLYSMRWRRGAYSGACIRVKRSSDSAELDIGWDANGYCDGAAILAFVGIGGSDTGTVTKWYDQSGGGVDLSDTTDTVKVVTAGVLQTFNGRTALRFDQITPSALAAAANSAFAFGTGAWTWEFFGDPTSNSGLGQGLVDFRDGGSSIALLYNGAGRQPTYFDGSNHSAGVDEVTFNSTMHHAASYVGGASSNMRLFTNGALSYTEAMTISFSGNRPLTIGAGYNAGVPWTGQCVEVRITNGTCEYTSAFTPINYFA